MSVFSQIFEYMIYLICAVYMLYNLKHDIHMLQQNSYRADRYYNWLRKSGDMLSAWRLTDILVMFILGAYIYFPLWAGLFMAGAVAFIKIILIGKRKFKKPLVFTRRVWRIYTVAGVLSLAAWLPAIVYGGPDSPLTAVILFALTLLSWAVALISLILLEPVEKAINRKYYNEARSILKSMPELTVIGITGSYGKTSTKHYLHRILSESYDTLMTPGSYNTPMGVIRTVREMMKPYHQIFICEMGAKQLGDIKEICDLVDPQCGIVTAVGPMHLESFKSIENVQRTKFELVDALPSNGFAVINNDFEYCANRKVSNVHCERYAVSHKDEKDNTPNIKEASYLAKDIKVTPQGTEFTISGPDGFEMRLTTRLVGECNISNLLAAVIMARHLNVPDEKIRVAVADIEQVEHRLNIKQTPGGVTIIDDAFNSNPSGSKMAIDVLDHFKEYGKRIIVTPGMIELGDRQYQLNKEFGEYIGSHVDIAVIVGQYNREAILEGISATDFDESDLILADTFNEAQQTLASLMKKGDTVLYENDLPDSFK